MEADGNSRSEPLKNTCLVSLQKHSRRSKITLIHCNIIGIRIYTMSQCDYLDSKFWHTFLAGGGITEL